MNSDKIIELYQLVRDGKDINEENIVTKDFILSLLGAPSECFVSDLEAIKFLLETRSVLVCANKMTIGNVYRMVNSESKKDGISNFN